MRDEPAPARRGHRPKIRHIGLSEINVDQLSAAQEITKIVSVQNTCTTWPPGAGSSSTPRPPRASVSFPGLRWPPIAADHDATLSQLALAWLLKRSSVMLSVPGTSSVAHPEENVAAVQIMLSADEFEALVDRRGSQDGLAPSAGEFGP